MSGERHSREFQWEVFRHLAYLLHEDDSPSPGVENQLIKLLVESTGSEAGDLILCKVGENELTILASYCDPDDTVGSRQDLHLELTDSLAGYCVMNAKPIVVSDVDSFMYRVPSRSCKSAICVPVRSSHAVLAVIALYSPTVNYYSHEDMDFLSVCTPLIAFYLRTYYKSATSVASPREVLESKNGFAFVLMPFHEPFNKYYRSIIQPSILEAGIDSLRADEIYRPSEIIKDIYDYIKNAKVLIAELTGRNPNVLYELGYGHAIGKTAILMTQTMEDVPFDLRGFRCLIYDTTDPDWANTLKTRLVQFIKSVGEQDG